MTYVFSGMFTAAGANYHASRLDSTGGTVGLGLEIVILTAVVLGREQDERLEHEYRLPQCAS